MRDKNLMLMYEPAASAADNNAISIAGEKSLLCGRKITSTPTKPMITALQRRRRTTSPSISTAPIVTNSGVEYEIEIACASGRCDSAQKLHNIETVPNKLRSRYRLKRCVCSRRRPGLISNGNAKIRPKKLRKNPISNACICSDARRITTAITPNITALAVISSVARRAGRMGDVAVDGLVAALTRATWDKR